ncbi:MAG TPA: hypothetical protein VGA56_07160, partial [Opitutaceae bacterium]
MFAGDGAAGAFEQTLWEAVARCEWQLHACVVMSNHYSAVRQSDQHAGAQPRGGNAMAAIDLRDAFQPISR